VAAGRNPFDILGISSTAEDVVINAAYKALARRYHPDMNPGVASTELEARMRDLNWARDELARDLAGWRSRHANTRTTNGSSSDQTRRWGATTTEPAASHAPLGTGIVVDQQVLFLTGYHGAHASFRASAAGRHGDDIRARCQDGVIDVERLESNASGVRFRVRVRQDFTAPLSDSMVEMIDLVAQGCEGSRVFVSVQPLTADALAQRPVAGRIAPPRHASPGARISFGKHRGARFREVAVVEPGYLQWMLREGAGSAIEQQCARLALEEIDDRVTLPHGGRAPRERVHSAPVPNSAPVREPSQPLALPDPNRPGGLFRALKGMFGSRRSSP